MFHSGKKGWLLLLAIWTGCAGLFPASTARLRACRSIREGVTSREPMLYRTKGAAAD